MSSRIEKKSLSEIDKYGVQKEKGYKQNQRYKWTMPSVAQLQAGEQSEQTNRQKRSSHTPGEGVCRRYRLLVDSEMKNGSGSGDDEEDQALQQSGRSWPAISDIWLEVRTVPVLSVAKEVAAPAR